MTQEVHSSPARRLDYLAKTDAAVAIPAAGNTDIITLDVTQVARLALEIINAGANAFDTFLVQGKVSHESNFITLLSAAADYTTPAGIVVDASGDLTILGAGATGWLILDVLGFTKIKLQASANVAGATSASIFAGGS